MQENGRPIISPLAFGVISGLFIIGASGMLAFTCLPPFTNQLFGSYSVILDFAIFLLSCGILSAIFINIGLHVCPPIYGEFDLSERGAHIWMLFHVLNYLGNRVLTPFTTKFMQPALVGLFGGKMGKEIWSGANIQDPYLVTVGDKTLLGEGVHIFGTTLINRRIAIAPVKIGSNVTIGVNSIIMPDVEIGDNAVVALNSVVAQGTRIPAGETWRGNPARKWQ